VSFIFNNLDRAHEVFNAPSHFTSKASSTKKISIEDADKVLE
jgi:hypothetical protein